MESRIYTPAAPLSTFIGCFWYWEGAPQEHTHERLMPNGEASLIFNLRDAPMRTYDAQDLSRYSTFRTAVVSGARSNCFGIDTNQQERVIGVQFRPGGAFPFFRAPGDEIANRSTDLEDLWPKDARQIRERLLGAAGVRSMFTILERSLLENLVRPLELHGAVPYALHHFSQPQRSVRIADVTDRLGLSARRFIEVFHRQVGLTPKNFCRVQRFQRVLERVHRKQHAGWAETALACGYCDQPHFIHEFRLISGLTPNAYLAAATPHLNHVRLT